MEKQYHFGILCNSLTFQQWQAAAIRLLLEDNRFRLTLVCVNDQPPARTTIWKKVSSKSVYSFLDNRLFQPEAKKPVDLGPDLSHIPQIKIQPVSKGRYSSVFNDEDISTIRGYQLDFLIRFGFNILKGDVLRAARWGVWSYHHGDPAFFRGGPPGFWEIMKRKPVTGAVLQKLTDQLDAGVVLHQGFYRTISHSYREQLNNLLQDSAVWILLAARKAAAGELDLSTPLQGRRGKIFRKPGGFRTLIFVVLLLRNRLSFYLKKYFFLEVWNIGLARTDPARLIADKQLHKVNWFPFRPKKGFAADPFAIETGAQLKVYYEDFSFRKWKGTICSFVFNPSSKKFSRPREEPFPPSCHLSYPFIMREENRNYCMPESFENRNVVLYELDGDSVTERQVLLEGEEFVDPTVFRWKDRYYIFCTLRKWSGHRLYIFHSETLSGPWLPHAGNPVKTDITSSRPAGQLFEVDGQWYRPAQDCSRTYGGSVVLNRIVELTPHSFAEEKAGVLAPQKKWKYNKGLHTISFAGGYTIFDVKRFRFSPLKAVRRP